MRKYFLFFAVSVLSIIMTSCASIYEYVQVVQTAPTSEDSKMSLVKDGYQYEDDKCVIFYSIWSNSSETEFGVYNKSDKIMYIDLSKSFYIKNGVAYDYYKRRTWSESVSQNSTTSFTTMNSASLYATHSASDSKYYFGNYGIAPYSTMDAFASSATVSSSYAASVSAGLSETSTISTGSSSAVAIKEALIISIPPHTSKMINSFIIEHKELLDCNLVRYPDEKSTVSYTKDSSPIVFANYVTYNFGKETTDETIKNEFYISNITNYPKPLVTSFIERDKPCENVLTPTQVKNLKHAPTVYDAYLKIPSDGCYYTLYSVSSQDRLYKTSNSTT